jgi:hypothetical protein
MAVGLQKLTQSSHHENSNHVQEHTAIYSLEAYNQRLRQLQPKTPKNPVRLHGLFLHLLYYIFPIIFGRVVMHPAISPLYFFCY